MRRMESWFYEEPSFTRTCESINYWVDPAGDLIVRDGHEDYLKEQNLSYDDAFDLGYIRLSVCRITSIPYAQWTHKASSRAKKTLGGFVKETNKVFYDVIKPTTDGWWETSESGEADYLKYWRV